jgi:hypothetical protein
MRFQAALPSPDFSQIRSRNIFGGKFPISKSGNPRFQRAEVGGRMELHAGTNQGPTIDFADLAADRRPGCAD